MSLNMLNIELAHSITYFSLLLQEIVNTLYADLFPLFEQRVHRPKNGINKWLNFLPVSTHKRLDRLKSQIFNPQSTVSSHGKKSVARTGSTL